MRIFHTFFYHDIFHPSFKTFEAMIKTKAKLSFKKQCFFVDHFFTYGNNRGSKKQWSTQQDSSVHLLHGTSPLPL